jgi:hypothetical protein
MATGVFLYVLAFICLVPYARLGVAPASLRLEMSVPQRRIDDHLIAICAKVTAASSGDVQDILQELLAGVHQKAERLKTRAARLLLNGEQLETERRKSMP